MKFGIRLFVLIEFICLVLLCPVFAEDDLLTSVAVAVSPELKLKRLETLENLKKKKHIIVTNLMGYLKYNAYVKEQEEFQLKIQKGKNISREIIIAKLEDLGYKKDSLVTATGEYAVRGFIIDVFPTFMEHPVRIEFFGSTIESIRFFDEDSQRSLEKINEVDILAIDEMVTDRYSSLLDYVPTANVVIFNKQQLMVGLQK